MSKDPDQHEYAGREGSWRLGRFESGPVPAAHIPTRSTDAIFFIQYNSWSATVHPNTAKKLSSVWMAVRDLEATLNEYESMGFRPARKLAAPRVGPKGQEIEAGEGTILLLQSNESTGKVASFLADRGAEGLNNEHTRLNQMARVSFKTVSACGFTPRESIAAVCRSCAVNPKSCCVNR